MKKTCFQIWAFVLVVLWTFGGVGCASDGDGHATAPAASREDAASQENGESGAGTETTEAEEERQEPFWVLWHYNEDRDDLRTLRTALSSGVLTHVIVGGTLHRKDRGLKQCVEAQSAVRLCRAANVKVIWLRQLWPLYAVLNSSAEDIFDVDYYTEEITFLRSEGEAVKADFVALDQEAYAKSPTKKYLRGRNKLSDAQFARLEEVIAETLEKVGQVDFIMPAGVMERPKQPCRVIARLGRHRVSETTYYDNAAFIARIDYPYEIFGIYVNTSKENETFPALPYYLIPEIFEHEQRWRNSRGVFLFSREHKAREVARELAVYAERARQRGQRLFE